MREIQTGVKVSQTNERQRGRSHPSAIKQMQLERPSPVCIIFFPSLYKVAQQGKGWRWGPPAEKILEKKSAIPAGGGEFERNVDHGRDRWASAGGRIPIHV